MPEPELVEAMDDAQAWLRSEPLNRLSSKTVDELMFTKHLNPGGNWGYELLKAFGMADKRVTHMVIDIPASGLVTVNVSMLVHDGNANVVDAAQAIIDIVEGAEVVDDRDNSSSG